MGKKSKGIDAERELIHLLWSNGWAAHRIAGSGSSKYPSPDIIAGNGARVLAIECKACKGIYQYFSKNEINELEIFSKKFGADAYVGVKFNNLGWFFMKTLHLKSSGNNFVMSRNMCKEYGKRVDEVFERREYNGRNN